MISIMVARLALADPRSKHPVARAMHWLSARKTIAFRILASPSIE
jgi:hypothetical protein